MERSLQTDVEEDALNESTIHAQLERYFEYVGADVERAAELYHDDAVLEFPQSGERFEGRAVFTEWRSKYPVPADAMRYRIRRTSVGESFSAVELSASYDGGQNWVLGVQLLDWREGRIIRERIYVMDPWEAPEWRAPWRSSATSDL